MTGQERSGAPASSDAASGAEVAFSVVSGDPTPDELAAVTAVLAAAAADAMAASSAPPKPQRGAWQRAQRPIRMPLSRGAGTWSSFTG